MKRKIRFGIIGRSLIIFNKRFDLILLALLGVIIYMAIRNSNRNEDLFERGFKTKAVVYKVVYNNGRKCYYMFSCGGDNYTGKVINNKYNVGDSISIMYKGSNPEINRDYNDLID